jgi:putative DNA methylase
MKKVESIKQLIEELKVDKSAFLRYEIGELSEKEIQQIKEATGFDLSGYTRTMYSYGVNHAIKKHGNPKKEESRGQIAITDDDFELIPQIVANPDSIEFGEKNDLGNDLIKYAKVIGNQLFYVEEIRNGRKEIVLQTLYKRKVR